MFVYLPTFSIWTKALIMLIKIPAVLNKGKNKILFVYFIKQKLLYNKINIYCFVLTFTDYDYAIVCKSKGLFKSKVFPLHGAFLLNIKHFRYKLRIQLNKIPLVVEEINYMTKPVNACILYD